MQWSDRVGRADRYLSGRSYNFFFSDWSVVNSWSRILVHEAAASEQRKGGDISATVPSTALWNMNPLLGVPKYPSRRKGQSEALGVSS